MLLSQFQLCYSVIKGISKDKHVSLQKISYRLLKMTNEDLYKNTSLSLKLRVEAIKTEHPENLRYLYFMPHFCLKNVPYSIFICTSTYSDRHQTRRNVFLWTDNRSMDNTGQIGAQIHDFDTKSGEKVKVILKATVKNWYYYLPSDTHQVPASEATTAPKGSTWNIKFLVNNRVVFSQNDFLMCDAEAYGWDRRLVRGLEKK